MIVDELILKLKADISDVEKRLKEVEGKASAAGKNAGAEMGKTMGTSFGDVFSAIAGAAVLNTVKGFFSKAAAEFNKMEAAMMRVDSIAKGFGRSVEGAKKQVNELADKGFLNLNQAASSYADAIALGFDEKQARKFIDALSDVAAFQNTIGDGAAAVQSGVSGLLSNSAEKVENIGVPIKVLNMAYNENIKTMGKAAALQKFYGGVLKESEKFAGDAARSVDTLAGAQNKYNAAVDKAMVAVGQGLEPVLKGLYETGRNVALAFADWFGKLNEGTKSIILVGAALVAIIPAFSAISTALAALSINPVVLMVTAVVAAGVAIAAVTNQLNNATPKDIVKAYKDGAKELDSLGEKIKNIESINKRTLSQEIELIQSKDKLRERARALGDDYEMLASKAKTYAEALQIVKNGERDKAAAQIDEQRRDAAMNITANRDVIKRIQSETGESLASLIARGVNGYKGMDLRDLASGQERFSARLQMADLARAELYSESTSAGKKVEASLAGSGATEQRFLESLNKIREIEKNRDFTILRSKGVKDEEERKRRIDAAIADANMQIAAEFTARRQAYAEYIEDKYMADTEALKRQTDDAIRASNEILEAGIKKAKGDEWEIFALEEDHEERLQKIRAANIRKENEISMKSFAETAQAANQIAGGISTLSKGGSGFASGTSQLFGGIGALSDKLKSVGMFGQVAGAVMGIGSMISEAFGKSDAERQAEADLAQRQRQEQLSLLELQAGYQKAMLAIQEAAAKLPFENLQRTLRLTDIQTQQKILSGVSPEVAERERLAQRREATAQVLQSESGAISGGALFSGTGSTPEELIAFLKSRAAQSSAVAYASQIINSIGDISGMTGRGAMNYASALLNQLGSLSEQIPPELYSEIYGRLSSVVSGFRDLEARTYNLDKMTVSSIDPSYYTSGANSLISEIGRDVGIAENLLSVIEQNQQVQLEISANTKKTADNTAKALELRPDRERSVIDVGEKFIMSMGQIIKSPSAIGIARSVSQNLTIPTELGAANVITGRARTLQERMADALETQIRQGATANDILRDIRAAAVELLAVMDGNPGTGSSMTMNDFVSLQSEANRRRV